MLPKVIADLIQAEAEATGRHATELVESRLAQSFRRSPGPAAIQGTREAARAVLQLYA